MAGKPKFKVEDYLEDIERLASLGLNQQDICLSLGFSVTTICKYKKISTQLAKAIKKGKAAAHKELTNTLFNAAVGEGNITAAMFLLKSQFNYRDHGPLPEDEIQEQPVVQINYIQTDGRDPNKQYPNGLYQTLGSSQTGEENDETEGNGTESISRYGNNRNG